MKKIVLLLFITFYSLHVYTQNNFLYNPMLYNPAITGYNNLLDISLLNNTLVTYDLYSPDRYFWNRQTLNMSMTLKDSGFGVGLNVSMIRGGWDYSNGNSDLLSIGDVNIFGAYHKELDASKISLGTSIGVNRNFVDIDYTNSGIEPTYVDSDYGLNLGLGGIFENKLGFIAISSPNIFARYRRVNIDPTSTNGIRNEFFNGGLLFLSAGMNLSVFSNELLVFRPSFNITQDFQSLLDRPLFQFNLTFQIYEILFVNTSYAIDSRRQSINGGDTIDFGIGSYIGDKYRVSINARTQRINTTAKITKPEFWELVLGYRMSNTANYPTQSELFFF